MIPLNFWCGWKLINKSRLFKNTTLFLIIVVTVVTLCQLLGCTRSTPPPPADKIVERAERYFQYTDNYQFPPELRKEIEIYVDGSASMRGFVTTQGNTVFSKLMRGLASSFPEYGISFFKFGTGNPQRLSLQEFWQMSSSRKLFDQSTTRLDSTIRSFLEEENPASAYLVITDGVQASPIGCDYPSFVNPINQWLGKNNHILHTYAFRSEFNGIIYSADTGNHFHYESDSHNPASFRPFYVYAFILDRNLEEEIIARMQDIMQDLGVESHFLNFSDQIIKKRELDFELPVKLQGKDKNKNSFREYYTKEVMGKTVKFLRWLDRGKGLGEGYLKVKFGLDLTDFGKEISQDLDRKVMIDVKIWHWRKERKVIKNSEGKTKIDYAWVSQKITNEDRYLSEIESIKVTRGEVLPKLSTTLRFQRMSEPGWYAYYIRLLPANDAFRIPSWTEDWSTMDDSTSENANRTLNFTNIVSSILNNVSISRMTLADFFVVINFR